MHNFPTHGIVAAVCKKATPGLPKLQVDAIQLIENRGIEGDYHAGKLVRHRYLAKKDPNQPNLRQVLLVDTSMLAEIANQGIQLEAGMLGENIVVDDIALMTLPIGTRLEIAEALLELTEVRNPCYQLNEMHTRLLETVKSEQAGVRHNAGMLARILRGGWVRPGDCVSVRA
jgi:MOSC domain-containing protein YiiM